MANLSYAINDFSEPSSALAAFTQAPDDYHIVITDFSMAGMTGLELVGHIRRIRPAIPTIVTSGVFKADHSDLVQPRMTFLPKPFTPEMLAKAVEAVSAPDGDCGKRCEPSSRHTHPERRHSAASKLR